jgi:hypothetical protein
VLGTNCAEGVVAILLCEAHIEDLGSVTVLVPDETAISYVVDKDSVVVIQVNTGNILVVL